MLEKRLDMAMTLYGGAIDLRRLHEPRIVNTMKDDPAPCKGALCRLQRKLMIYSIIAAASRGL